ncbi:MAG: GTP-binding protein [Myxococcaceae bacterium]|nr:GTP-binding protein [Myxococcaceae bacterium]
MSTVNVMAREIAAKIVFYGPGLSGKTTTLKRVYDSVKPAHRGELMSLPTEADRTLFFDFLPVKVERVNEYSVRLALYTVPGQVFYNATRKLVLQGADGVVFVADSQPEAEDANRESLLNLEENLSEQGIRIEKFPVVLQYNKRDIEGVSSVDHLRTALNTRSWPDFETCATSGHGVLDTLKAIMRLVIKDLRQKKVVPARPSRPEPPQPLAQGPADGGLEGQLRQHLAAHPLGEVPPMATPSRGVPAITASDRPIGVDLGPASALAPSALLDPARVADTAYAAGDWDACVRACQEGVRRALNFTGEGPPGAQAYLLGLDGRDLLTLGALVNKHGLRVDDAAFALYVLMQTFARLATAGLPHQGS